MTYLIAYLLFGAVSHALVEWAVRTADDERDRIELGRWIRTPRVTALFVAFWPFVVMVVAVHLVAKLLKL